MSLERDLLRIRCTIVLILFVLLLSFTNNASVYSYDNTGNLLVLVTDIENNPLSGATILLRNPSTEALVYEECFPTLQNGECFIEGIKPDYYKIEVYYSPEHPCWPANNTLLIERFFYIIENTTHTEYCKTNYPISWVKIIERFGVATIVGAIIGLVGTYCLTIRKEEKDELKEEEEKKKERVKNLKLIVSELEKLIKDLDYVRSHWKPTNIKVSTPFVNYEKVPLYLSTDLSILHRLPLKTPIYDSIQVSYLIRTLNSDEILSIAETYEIIKKFDEQIKDYNFKFKAISGENYLTAIDENNLRNKIKDLIISLKKWLSQSKKIDGIIAK